MDDNYDSMDLPALIAERDRLTKKITEARVEERGPRKIAPLEESLQQVNAKIATKSPEKSEVGHHLYDVMWTPYCGLLNLLSS